MGPKIRIKYFSTFKEEGFSCHSSIIVRETSGLISRKLFQAVQNVPSELIDLFWVLFLGTKTKMVQIQKGEATVWIPGFFPT